MRCGASRRSVTPIFSTISRSKAHRRIVDELLGLFGGRTQPLMSHLIESGQLTLEDVEEARKALRKNEQ